MPETDRAASTTLSRSEHALAARTATQRSIMTNLSAISAAEYTLLREAAKRRYRQEAYQYCVTGLDALYHDQSLRPSALMTEGIDKYVLNSNRTGVKLDRAGRWYGVEITRNAGGTETTSVLPRLDRSSRGVVEVCASRYSV